MNPDLKIYSDKTVGKRIASNAGLIIGAKAIAVILGLGTLKIAAHVLDPVAFGTVVFLHAYMLFFGEVTTFKTWQSIIRFGADDLENEDAHSVARLIKFGMKIDLLSVILAYFLSVALMGLIIWIMSIWPSLGGDDVEIKSLQKYAALYCLVVLLRQTGTADGILRLFDRFKVLAFEAIVMPALRFMGSVIVWLTGGGFEQFLLVWFVASGVSYIVVFFLAMWELHKRRLLGLVISERQNFIYPRKGLWGFVFKSNVDSSIASGFGHLPTLLVMAVFGPVWSGIYKIAEEVMKLLSEGFKLLDQVIYPELAKMIASQQAGKIWRIVQRSAIAMLAVGALSSTFIWFAGPSVLAFVFGEDFRAAAPLAALLVPAAALLGMAAPLYPILYAADKPERAIYVRGASLLVYIASFLLLSFFIGELAPGWAMIVGNLFAGVVVIIVARRTLNESIQAEQVHSTVESDNFQAGDFYLIGQSNIRLWGLPLEQWQKRAYKKVGADKVEGPIVADINWVLSANLHKAFIASSNTALVTKGQIIAINGMAVKQASRLIGQSMANAELVEVEAKTPQELDGGYIKALRKNEKPYALNVNEVGVAEISRRQYASSYKGITDFVTKFIWPVPAFYATRFCAWLRLTPNMVTTLSLIMMFVALYYFWHGQWVLGFLTGWFMTFLDTVDGKLARTTMTYSSWGNIYDHGIDLLHPPLWYVAWYVGLGGTMLGPEILQISLIAIFIGYIVDRLVEGVFIARFGFHIHVWRPFNSALRFVIARRNPNMFIFMMGMAMSLYMPDAGVIAFIIVAVWIWVCIGLNILSLLAAMFSRKPVVSWMDK